MAPVMSVPQGHSFPNGRVIRPEEMRAVTVNRDTEVIMKDQKGNRIEVDVDKGLIGYLMCDAPDMEGYVLCQLMNNNGDFQTVAIRKTDVDVGQLHGLRVEEAHGQSHGWICYHITCEGREMSVFRTFRTPDSVHCEATDASEARFKGSGGVNKVLDFSCSDQNRIGFSCRAPTISWL